MFTHLSLLNLPPFPIYLSSTDHTIPEHHFLQKENRKIKKVKSDKKKKQNDFHS